MFLVLVFYLTAMLAQPLLWAGSAEGVDDLIHFSHKQEEALVVKVVSSDGVILEDGRHIKMIGIESAGSPPRKYLERDGKGNLIKQVESADIPLEDQAVAYAQSLLEGQKVRLEFDVESLSSDGKRQAYVFLSNGKFANAELLRQGFVYLKIRPPNIKYVEKLREAYMEAKREQRGFLGG